MLRQTLFFVLLFYTVEDTLGHGRLMVPPSRNAMWRYGYRNPVNYNDNELFCGGFIVQYNQNKGKCGVCGDNWTDKTPRSHEAGGIYGNGIIGRTYFAGQEIEIEADLTTNHKGWMEAKLCANDDPNKVITQSCLDRYPLQMADGSGPRFIIPEESKKTEIFKWKIKLPDDVTCSQCVIQWKYFAGNTWGTCNNGSESIGCGSQETFINCADVSIVTQTPSNQNNIDSIWTMYFKGAKLPTTPGTIGGLVPLIVRAQVCYAKGKYSNTTGMNEWCFENCLKYPPNCPAEVCSCPTECTAVNEFAQIKDADVWCHQHCLRNPPNCPEERCKCQ